jgi:hypothetical protein
VGRPALVFPAAPAVTFAVGVWVVDRLRIRPGFRVLSLAMAVAFAGAIVWFLTLNLSVPRRCVDVKTLTVAATRDCQEPSRPGGGATEARFAWYWGGSNSGQDEEGTPVKADSFTAPGAGSGGDDGDGGDGGDGGGGP